MGSFFHQLFKFPVNPANTLLVRSLCSQHMTLIVVTDSEALMIDARHGAPRSPSFVQCSLLPLPIAKGGASADARQLFAGKHIDDACAADARAHHDHARMLLDYLADDGGFFA